MLKFWIAVSFCLGMIIYGANLIGRKSKNELLIQSKNDQLKKRYKQERVFLCNHVEDLDGTNFQLYGEALNTFLRPGMRIVINGKAVLISEVYANDDTPDKPDREVPPEVPDTPIVIAKGDWDFAGLQRKIKEEKVAALKLQ